MPSLNLSPDYLTQVKAILKQYIPEQEVWAYGSRVNGNCHEASDLDLVIRNPDDLQKKTDKLSQIKQAFTDSNLPFLVDLMDWASLPERYREEINNQHLVIMPGFNQHMSSSDKP